jgi:hypothetical protein
MFAVLSHDCRFLTDLRYQHVINFSACFRLDGIVFVHLK